MSPLHVVVILSALLFSAQSVPIQDLFDQSSVDMGNAIEEIDNSIEADEFTVSTLLEKANKHAGQGEGDPVIVEGDIAVMSGLQNADPCTARGCKWQKYSDGNVYVFYTISNQFSSRERNLILEGLNSFSTGTCIRFYPRRTERDFLDIQSRSGCWSYVGRRGNAQVVSLQRGGCIYKGTIQHELLHALGFNHEQTRSDRDEHVRILLENVISGLEYNFDKIDTNNLETPYDYNSVMQYSRYAFSSNQQPTIVPIPDPNVAIGRATEMSRMDLARINRLYECQPPYLADSTLL